MSIPCHYRDGNQSSYDVDYRWYEKKRSQRVTIKTDDEFNVEWIKPGYLGTFENGSLFVVNRLETGTDLTLLDSLGTEVLTANIKSDRIRWCVMTHDNEFLFFGEYRPDPDNRYTAHTYFTKVDSLGNQLWEKSHDIKQVRSITRIEMGEFLVTTNERILKLDSEGNIMSREYFDYGIFMLGPFIASNGMGLCITVKTQRQNSWDIITFDTLLENLVFDVRSIDISTLFDEAVDGEDIDLSGIVSTQEEGFVVWGGFERRDEGSWIIKTDFLMNKEWSKVLPNLAHISVKVLDDASLLVAGGVLPIKYEDDPRKVKRTRMSFDGTTDGKYFSYYSDNGIESAGMLEDDLMVGDWKFFYEGNVLKGEGSYSGGDWSDPGDTGIPRNGRDGQWVFSDSLGNKNVESFFQNGILHGQFFSWYPSGQLMINGGYDRGRKNGDFVYYSPTGEDSSICSWAHDVGAGVERDWYLNGQPFATTVYDGKKTGMLTGWYENGNIRVEGEVDPIEEKFIGDFIRYFENGNKSYERVADRWISYNLDGTVRDIDRW